MPFDLPPAPVTAPRILVIDPDLAVIKSLRAAFAGNDLAFEQARSGPEARVRLGEGGVDLVIMELDLPGANGLDLLRDVRSETKVPVIVVTARAPKLASVLCLELGADDYVLKPADADELNARIRAVLRRRTDDAPSGAGFGEAAQAFSSGIVTFAGWRFDTVGLSLWSASGELVNVTTTEAAVLRHLVLNARRPITRAEINEHVHGRSTDCDARSIDVLIKKLRAKMTAFAPNVQAIKSVRGVGYIFVLDVRPAP